MIPLLLPTNNGSSVCSSLQVPASSQFPANSSLSLIMEKFRELIRRESEQQVRMLSSLSGEDASNPISNFYSLILAESSNQLPQLTVCKMKVRRHLRQTS